MQNNTLNLDQITVQYHLGGNRIVYAVNPLSLTLESGKTIGLIGESGCGKSSLAKALVGLEKMTSGVATLGHLTLNSQSGKNEILRWRKAVQMVFQDPHTSLNPRMRLNEILTEVLHANTSFNKQEKKERILYLLNAVGLSEDALDNFPHQFSGGQRQRIGIARALAVGASHIILDEVVSALDVSVQAQIIELLKSLQKSEKLAFLFVTHDLALLQHLAQEVVVMYLGHCVEFGPTLNLIQNPQHPYTQALVLAIPTLKQGLSQHYTPLSGEPPSPLAKPKSCPFSTRCPHVMPVCHESMPTLKSVNGRKIACHLYV